MRRTWLGARKSPGTTLESALGGLEQQVLEGLWAHGREASVRELQGAFGGKPAYTTLKTTLDRLYKKGFLDRRRVGRAFHYAPRFTPDSLREELAADLIDGLLGPGRPPREAARPILSTFIDAVESRDAELLDELAALIASKRAGKGPDSK
jgi:predicted transcriptional regulator